MKKIVLTMVALLSMTAMMAQTSNNANGKKQKMSHEEMTTQMTSKLNLDDAQKSKVAALNKEYQEYLMPQAPQQQKGEKKTNKKDNKKTAAKKTNSKKPDNSQMKAKRQEYEKQLKGILTDEQYKKYQKMGPQGKDKDSKKKDTKNTKNTKSKKNKKAEKVSD